MKIKTLKTMFIKFLAKIKNRKLELETEDEDLKEDYITKNMGSFGVYQLAVCTIVSLSRFSAMWNVLSSIFITPKTDFICKEFYDNISIEEVNNLTCYNDCVEYEYYQKVFRSTVISKFKLVCDRAWLVDFAHIVFMLGVLLGSWLFGWIADRQGRRVSLRLATFYNTIFTLIVGFSINYWMYIIIRFIIGITSGGIFVISIVYVLEVVGSNHKEIAAYWILLADGIAETMMTIFAYYSSSWDMFIFEYLAVCVLFFFLILILPDTPRWYVSQEKVKRAIEVAMRAALWNNRNTIHIENNIRTHIEKLNVLSERTKTQHMHLLYQKETIKNTICVFVMCTQVGSGLCCTYKYITMLVQNVYIALILLGFVQMLASILSIALNKIFERRSLLMVVFFVNMVSVSIFYFLPKDCWVTILTVVTIHGSIIISFAVIYILTAELYPTPIRCFALGMGTSGLIVGAIVTLFVVLLESPLNSTIYFAIFPIIALGFCIILPETKGCNLKDTVELSFNS